MYTIPATDDRLITIRVIRTSILIMISVLSVLLVAALCCDGYPNISLDEH